MLYFINPKEGWMSGLNQQFTKLSFPLNGTVGSNPTPSALYGTLKATHKHRKNGFIFQNS